MSQKKAAIQSFRNELAQIARTAADKTALIDARSDQKFTYKELVALIARFGSLFRDHNLGDGAIVMVVGANCPEFLVSFFAATQHGLGFVPVSVETPVNEVERWVKQLKPAYAIALEGTSAPVVEFLRGSGIALNVVRRDSTFSWLPQMPCWTSLHPGKHSYLYLTTSGSTGEPRAMVFDIDVLWSSARAFTAFHRTHVERRRFWNILPMSYLGGLFNLGLIPLAAEGSVVIDESFSGRSFLDFWQSVERFEVDVLWIVPTIVRGLLALAQRTRRAEVASGHHKAQICLLGTAPIDVAAKKAFEDTFHLPVLENFALSETTFLTSETVANRQFRTEASTGEILPYVDLRFRPVSAETADDSGAGENVTEILAATPYAFVGYLQEDGSIKKPFDEDGYLATGDVGHLDANGQVVITGRLRDFVKKGGYFIALGEIEAIAQSNPSVEESAAVRIAHNFYGEDYVLYVRFAAGSQNAETEFGQWLRQRLAKNKWPDRIVAVTDFPRTRSGKIRKHLIASESAK